LNWNCVPAHIPGPRFGEAVPALYPRRWFCFCLCQCIVGIYIYVTQLAQYGPIDLPHYDSSGPIIGVGMCVCLSRFVTMIAPCQDISRNMCWTWIWTCPKMTQRWLTTPLVGRKRELLACNISSSGGPKSCKLVTVAIEEECADKALYKDSCTDKALCKDSTCNRDLELMDLSHRDGCEVVRCRLFCSPAHCEVS
jgi:hypothetical protein